MRAPDTANAPAPAGARTAGPAGSPPGQDQRSRLAEFGRRVLRALLYDRVVLLAVLLVVVLGWMKVLERNDYLVAAYDLPYLASSLESMVPLCLLALAQLLVMVSGRGGIDLSVGSMVSLAGMALGFMVGQWDWPVALAIPACLAFGAALGAVNGLLVAYVGFLPLIATLATYYAYSSLALVSNANAPISTEPVRNLHSLTQSVPLPFGGDDPVRLPMQVLTVLLPCAVLVGVLVHRTTFGRRLFAAGTNEVAATFAAISVARVRFSSYVLSGALSAVVAVVTVGQFASARPDAGTTGNGMALPAITIAVLGGVAITGGVGRVAGVVIAALLVTWLSAGILLAFEGSRGGQYELFALGAVLLLAALFNRLTLRGRGGAG